MARFNLGNIRGPQGPPGRDGKNGRDGADGRTADVATRTSNGLMSKEDKIKLDGIPGTLKEIKDLYTEQNKAIDNNTSRLSSANDKLERYL